MESLIAIGNTVVLTPAGAATANVANVATRTNTFHITNASTSVYAYVGVFNNYTAAAAMDHPSVGTDGGGVIVTPNSTITLTGNFGTTANTSTVYVSAITATGSTSVFATPAGRN